MKHAGVLLLASLLVAMACGPAHAASAKPCKVMSVQAIPGLPTAVPSCAVFHETGPPLVVPADTLYTRFGTLSLDYRDTTQLTDRTGKMWRLLPTARPPINATALQSMQLSGWNHGLVVAGAFNKAGNLTGFRPLFHVPYATMLAPFRSTQFVGTINSMGQPAGINATAWVRWNFGAAVNRTGSAKSENRLPGWVQRQQPAAGGARQHGKPPRPGLSCSAPPCSALPGTTASPPHRATCPRCTQHHRQPQQGRQGRGRQVPEVPLRHQGRVRLLHQDLWHLAQHDAVLGARACWHQLPAAHHCVTAAAAPAPSSSPHCHNLARGPSSCKAGHLTCRTLALPPQDPAMHSQQDSELVGAAGCCWRLPRAVPSPTSSTAASQLLRQQMGPRRP
jgi:hypothetical protein